MTHQQDTEEQAMMVWETLHDSMIDNAEEEKSKANETNFLDAEDDDFNFLVWKLKFQEIVPGEQISLKKSHECKAKVEMRILMILHQLIMPP